MEEGENKNLIITEKVKNRKLENEEEEEKNLMIIKKKKIEEENKINESGSSGVGNNNIFGILKEVWLNHIFIYFDTKTKKRVQSVCKTFYFLINQITKWSIQFQYLEKYLKFYNNKEEKNNNILLEKKEKEEKWKPNIYHILIEREFNDYSILNKIPKSNIKSLEFYNSNIKDSELSYLPSSLENLILNNCYGLTNEGIKNLPTSLKSLEIIESYYQKLTRQIIEYLPKGFIELKIISIELEDSDLKELPSSLTKLNLENQYKLTNDKFKYLSKNLKYLELNKIDNFNEEGLKLIPSNITYLSISNCSKINDNSLKYIPSNIIHLKLNYCENINGIGFQYLTLLSNLKKLEIDGKYLTDEGMKILHNLTIIQSLDLNSNKNITNEGIKYLPLSLTSLRLNFNENKITKECLLNLPSNLIKLEIYGSNRYNYEEIDEEILTKLPSSIKDLTLNYFTIKNGNLKYLNSNIEQFYFYSCRIDEESMKSISKGKKK
jgi:hypothetical protein